METLREISSNTNANSLYSCAYCNKNYVRKSAYNNHLIKCKYATKQYKSKQCKSNSVPLELESITLESLSRDVNIHNLFTMVIMLHNKYEKLESEYNELKKYVTVVKNKINILDYLNENFKHDYLNDGANIKNFMANLVLQQDHLQKIFKHDYVDGIFNIICEYIDTLNVKGLLLPIKCFNTKENVLYIFDGLQWIIMDDTYLRAFIKSFDKKILTLFVEWKASAEKSIDPEIFGEIYIQNMKKVIAGNYEKKNPALMIKSRLYKYLKNDLKSIVHYDFI